MRVVLVLIIVVIATGIHPAPVVIEVVHMGLVVIVITVAKPDAARKGGPGDR